MDLPQSAAAPVESSVEPGSLLARAASYLDVPRSLTPPIWRELSPTLLRAPFAGRRTAPKPPVSPHHTVVLVPGFLAPDRTTAALAAAIRGAGHRTRYARLGTMNGCSEALASRLVDRLAAIATSAEDRFTLVGHSRGGQIAKVAAVRRPDLIEGVITLGSPLTDEWGMHLSLKLVIAGMGLLGSGLDVGRCGDIDCPFGACLSRFAEDLRGHLADDIRFTSIYSRRDGIVQWRACLDPGARHVEVRCSHLEMAFDPKVIAEILGSLAQTPAQVAA